MNNRDNAVFQGDRLNLARTLHGLTLEDLGNKVSATRQYIQRLESDPKTTPSSDMLDALVEYLKVPLSFFYEPIYKNVREEECHFRKRKTTPQHVRNRAIAYGTIFNSLALYLEEILDLPEINIPPFEAQTLDAIEKATEQCRVRWNLRLDAPIDSMTRVLENAGCLITTFKGVSEKIDAFSYFNFRPIIVRNDAKASKSRARFDLAHECGHLVLHQGLEVGDSSLEDEANKFASAFLLPRVAFLREFPKSPRLNWNKIILLKKRWGVSIQAIIRRAYDLRIIDAIQYRNANVYISRNGWRKSEPAENELKDEPIEILAAAFDQLKEYQSLLPRDIAKILHLSCYILEKFDIHCNEAIDKSNEKTKKGNVVFLDSYMNKLIKMKS